MRSGWHVSSIRLRLSLRFEGRLFWMVGWGFGVFFFFCIVLWGFRVFERRKEIE